jgi:hypothetical protein
VHRTPTLTSDEPVLAFFEHGGEAFEVLDDTALLDMALRTSSTSPCKITFGSGHSIDVTRILPPTSRLTASVVLSDC